jgi:hypothetical protein
MKHPSEATLALHAGQDLGTLARWRVSRHLAGCARCREEVAAFAEVRAIVPGLMETPGIAWNRLAADMRANIRLGLAAGECVRIEEPQPPPLFWGARALVAVASVVVLTVTGLVLEHPAPNPAIAKQQGAVLQRMADGIQVREGDRTLRLMHHSARDRDITYTVSAQGSMEARYVDSGTGYVTINNVYAE